MRIRLAKSAGFCFGVKRALDIAMKAAQNQDKVIMLGDIVHNEAVVNKIVSFGIRKTKRLKKANGHTLLIRAHGEPLEVFKAAKRLGYKITDATCPMVKEIHRIAKEMEGSGYRIIVIGDKNHDEVRGITGQLKNESLVIGKAADIPFLSLKSLKKACVVVQSTQNQEDVLAILSLLKKKIPDLKFFNTICRPTRIKQAEIKDMPLKNDVMIIIGSKNSANTKRLYEISRKLNKNSWWINSKDEIKSSWFKHAKSIGITAGASTPKESIDEIMLYLSGLIY